MAANCEPCLNNVGVEFWEMGRLVFSLEGTSVFSVRSTYEVHFGTPTTDGGTRFASEVGTAIRSDGMPGWLEQHDFDGDGQIDMTVTALDVGFFKAIGSVLSRSAAPVRKERKTPPTRRC
jgi:hypothetical protein